MDLGPVAIAYEKSMYSGLSKNQVEIPCHPSQF
jgi:hypothetical protein